MPLVDAVCPHCGAPLKVNPDAKTLTCRYCGNEFVVQDAINNINIKDSVVHNDMRGSTIYINNGEKSTNKNLEEEYVDLYIILTKSYYDPFSVSIDDVCMFTNNKKTIGSVKVKKGYHTVCIDQAYEASSGAHQFNFQCETYLVIMNHIFKPFEWDLFDRTSNTPVAKEVIKTIDNFKEETKTA